MRIDGATATGTGDCAGVPLPAVVRHTTPRPHRTGFDWPTTSPAVDPDAVQRIARAKTVTPRLFDPNADTGGRPRLALDVETLAQEYRDGASVRQLATKHGVATQTIRARLHDAGVEMRPPRFQSQVPIERIVELHEQGLPVSRIAAEVGLLPTSISFRLRAVGIYVSQAPAPFDVQEAARLYNEGASTYDLAAKYGVGRKTVAGYLRAEGVQMRPGGGSRRTVDTADVVELAGQGMTQAAIGERLGISDRTVRDHLAKSETPTTGRQTA